MHRLTLCSALILALAASFLIASPAALAETGPEAAPDSLHAVLADAPLFLLQSPQQQAFFQCSELQAEAEIAEKNSEVSPYGSCSETITCPGGGFIPPHNISCNGNYSCSIEYNPSGQACAVKCDGMARECFPNGCF